MFHFDLVPMLLTLVVGACAYCIGQERDVRIGVLCLVARVVLEGVLRLVEVQFWECLNFWPMPGWDNCLHSDCHRN